MRPVGWCGVECHGWQGGNAWIARALCALAVVGCALALAPRAGATAASFTWNGEAAGPSWSAPRNWEGETAPASPGPVALDFPRLTGTGCASSPSTDACYESSNDIGGLEVESIRADDGDEYEIGGEEITLGGGGLTAAPAAGASGPAGDLIELPIRLGAAQTWNLAGSGRVGENGVFLGGGLTGSGQALTLDLSDGPVVYLGGATEVGPVAIDGANERQPGAVNGVVDLEGVGLDSTDGSPVSLSHIFFLGSGTIGPLTSSGVELNVGRSRYPAKGIETPSATFDAASAVAFQITGAGTSAGVDYSQLAADGAIALGGSSLYVQASPPSAGEPCPSPSPGQMYTLVSTTGTLSGSFGNAPEGGEIPIELAESCAPASRYLRIAYHRSGAAGTVTGTVVGPSGSPPPEPEPEPTPLPAPENKPTPFERPSESWVGSSAAEGAAREQAEAEAESRAREAREAANSRELPAVLPIPPDVMAPEPGEVWSPPRASSCKAMAGRS